VTVFRGAAEDLLRNIHDLAKVAQLDGDEVGYLLGKVAETKWQKGFRLAAGKSFCRLRLLYGYLDRHGSALA
jgi:hypothetical protein